MPTRITIDETDLVALLKSKDQRGFSILYNNYSGALYTIIYRIVSSDETAADLLQDSFVKIWKTIDRYDSSKAGLYAWIFNITRNLAIDQVRSASYRQTALHVELEESITQVDEQYQSRVSVDEIGLKGIVEKLKPAYKQLIELVYYKGYTQSEVSKELNIPLGTVKTHISKAISQLRLANNVVIV